MPARGQYVDMEEYFCIIPYMLKLSKEVEQKKQQEANVRLQQRVLDYRIMKMKEQKER
jgi:hypothetical protein